MAEETAQLDVLKSILRAIERQTTLLESVRTSQLRSEGAGTASPESLPAPAIVQSNASQITQQMRRLGNPASKEERQSRVRDKAEARRAKQLSNMEARGQKLSKPAGKFLAAWRERQKNPPAPPQPKVRNKIVGGRPLLPSKPPSHLPPPPPELIDDRKPSKDDELRELRGRRDAGTARPEELNRLKQLEPPQPQVSMVPGGGGSSDNAVVQAIQEMQSVLERIAQATSKTADRDGVIV